MNNCTAREISREAGQRMHESTCDASWRSRRCARGRTRRHLGHYERGGVQPQVAADVAAAAHRGPQKQRGRVQRPRGADDGARPDRDAHPHRAADAAAPRRARRPRPVCLLHACTSGHHLSAPGPGRPARQPSSVTHTAHVIPMAMRPLKRGGIRSPDLNLHPRPKALPSLPSAGDVTAACGARHCIADQQRRYRSPSDSGR